MSKRNKRNKNVGGGAEQSVESVPEKFATEGEANEALSQVAKVTNIETKKKENDAKAAAKAAKAPKLGKDGRPKLPPLPRGATKSKPLVDCGCGCGMQTRSKFAPGHDSRLRGWSLRIARGLIKLADVGTLASEGEMNAVAAHIKELKKEGKYEALKTPQVPTGAAKAAKDKAAGE